MGREQWEKEKLLIMSNFFFSHGVFDRLVMQACITQDLHEEGLSIYAVHICKHDIYSDLICSGARYTSPADCNQLADNSFGWLFPFIYRRYRLPIWATPPEDG